MGPRSTPSAPSVQDCEIALRCRTCGAASPVTVLELGEQPLANDLRKSAAEPQARFPLTLQFCPECRLVQLRETLRKEVLFKHYVWITGTSATARGFARSFFTLATGVVKPAKDDLIVELASNDGTFLKPFLENGYRRVLGVDPAENIAEAANQAGVPTLAKFWSAATAKDVRAEMGGARMAIARNVLPHVGDAASFLDGMRLCLEDDGVAVIEFHDAGVILRELQYDSIYHEHLRFFSLRSVTRLLNDRGLFPFHAEQSPISGGGYVLFSSKTPRPRTAALEAFMQGEEAAGANSLEAWKRFGADARRHREKSLELARALPQPVVGFGASARSSTYLNFCGFGAKQLPAVIDNNPLKQGLFTPGAGIPIVSFDAGLALKPATMFVLAWNFKDEVLRVCREKGFTGGYLLPFPKEPTRA